MYLFYYNLAYKQDKNNIKIIMTKQSTIIGILFNPS